MSENLRLYTTVMFGLEQTLARVPASAWDRASPCAEFRAHLGHRQRAGIEPHFDPDVVSLILADYPERRHDHPASATALRR